MYLMIELVHEKFSGNDLFVSLIYKNKKCKEKNFMNNVSLVLWFHTKIKPY